MKSILAIASVTFSSTLALFANPIAMPVAEKVALDEEAVEITIAGDKATVSGVYHFKTERAYGNDVKYDLYLPIYASEKAKPSDITPSISINGKALKVEHTTDKPVKNLSTIKGQVPMWFKVSVGPGHAGPDRTMEAKITYSQALADGKFIYTPIIPKQEKGKDYGSITLSAKSPLSMVTATKLNYKEKDGKLIVEPHHLKSIIVSVGSQATKKIP